ncbi:hypothetical protein CEXT_223191, partial [Caerostris extrusa]
MFLHNSRNHLANVSRPLGTAKLDRAETYLVKIQEQEFTSEIRNLQRKRCVQPS